MTKAERRASLTKCNSERLKRKLLASTTKIETSLIEEILTRRGIKFGRTRSSK